jgi:hypothetical protein
MRRSRLTALIVAVAAPLALVAACSGGDDDARPAPPSSIPVTAEPDPEPTVVAPLTGLPLDDESRLDRPALVVKIDNHNRDARPQVGLDRADVVYEELVEGGATRFAAVFHSADGDPVGPVRSARTTDLDLTANLNRPLFAWSGANNGVSRQIRSAALVDMGWDAVPKEYYRAKGRRAPNNLFTRTSRLFELAPEGVAPPPTLFHYRAEGAGLAVGATPADGVTINFGGSTNLSVEWTWDDAADRWLRTQAGTPHTVEGGARISAENVIVQFTRYVNSGFVDTSGAASPEAEMIGEGEVWVLTDGRVVRGTWRRTGAGATTVYTAASGDEITFTAGRTWVELPRPGQATVATPAPPSSATAAAG